MPRNKPLGALFSSSRSFYGSVMDVALETLAPKLRYKLLTALIIPRPIAWITSLDEQGRVNAAPYSFFNVLGNRPPVVAFGPGDRSPGVAKDTAQNVEQAKEFVVNLVDPDCVEQMHRTAAPFPAEISEVEALGLKLLPSTKVKAPRLAASKVHLECTYWDTIRVIDNRIIVGLIEHLHTAEGIIDSETYHLDPDRFQAVGRLQGPGWYATTRDRIDLGRFPSVETALEGNK